MSSNKSEEPSIFPNLSNVAGSKTALSSPTAKKKAPHIPKIAPNIKFNLFPNLDFLDLFETDCVSDAEGCSLKARVGFFEFGKSIGDLTSFFFL